MKKYILLTVVSILGLKFSLAQDKLQINLNSSSVKWVGEKVTGSHSGYVNLKEAHFILKDEKLESGAFVIDMNSIKCTDIESPVYAAKLENHLKDNDFFATEQFPEASFTFQKVVFDGTAYMITGNMIVRGVRQEVTFPAQFHNDKGIFIADASLKIDRTKHDIKYGSGNFFDDLGDRMIYDDFTIKVHLETTK